MINRPSYAQRTLEVTRRSLEHLPTGLSPAVSGVLVTRVDQPVDQCQTIATPTQIAAACTRIGGLVSLGRWRRKSVDPRMAVR
jgi:hypothetical protein